MQPARYTWPPSSMSEQVPGLGLRAGRRLEPQGCGAHKSAGWRTGRETRREGCTVMTRDHEGNRLTYGTVKAVLYFTL